MHLAPRRTGANVLLSIVISCVRFVQGAGYHFLLEAISATMEISRGMVVVNEFKQTGDTKIFAGGDITNRIRDAISAIANGHSAAKGIDIYLTKFANGKST